MTIRGWHGLVAAGLLAVLGSARARADTPGDAWAVARTMLPSGATLLMGANIATARQSAMWKQVYPALAAQGGGAPGLGKVKSSCGFDPASVVQGVVVALTDDHEGVFFVSTKGFDPAKLSTCLGKILTVDKKKVSVGKADPHGIVEYTLAGKKLYLASLPHGVFALASDPSDKALLTKWLSGKGLDAKSVLGAAAGKVDSSAALWGVLAKQQQLQAGTNMSAIYGGAQVTAGNLVADLHLVLGSAKEAKAAMTLLNAQLAQATQSGRVPPQLVVALKSLKISASQDELVAKATVSEVLALGMLGMLQAMASGLNFP